LILQSCQNCSWGTQNSREKGLEDIVSTESTPALLTPPTKRSIRADHLLWTNWIEKQGQAVRWTMARLTSERRRALELLARDRHGVNKELLILGHGFSRLVLAGLIAAGLATAEREVVNGGAKTVEVVRVKITAAGREAIEG
jgi:hypothetical protein